MDSGRQSISRSGERPVTRWRREQEPIDKPNGFSDRPVSRSYNKMERPTSRRGVKTDITEYGISRPPTSNRNMSRPPSASILPNRVPTASSRMNNSANLSRMNTGLPRNFPQSNIMVLDRPMTQHGSAGVRPGSAQGVPRLSRQIQDKRYYKQLLHLKIRDLNQEMATLTRNFGKRNEESNDIYYNKKTKDLALKELQDQIKDYSITLDKMTVGTDKEELKQQVMQLKELQDQKDAEIHHNFERRQSAENKINELNKELENRTNANGYGEIETRSRLNIEKNQIQKEFDGLQVEYEQLINEKSKLEDRIHLSIKQEAYKLYLKIFETEQKRERLLNEDNNSLILEDENGAQKEIIEIQKRIADAEQELRQLESETDEDQPENQLKYNDLKKQEDVMSNISSSGNDRAEEFEKLNYLEEKIVERLEQISNSINGNFDSSILMPDEMEMLQILMNQNFESHHEKTLDEIKQEINRLREIISKLDVLEFKIRSQTSGYKQNFKSMQDLTTFDNSQEERKVVEEVRTNKKDYSKLVEKLEQNEIYRTISIMEDKIRKTTLDNEKFEESIIDQVEQNHTMLLEKLLSLTSQYNAFLIADLKTVY